MLNRLSLKIKLITIATLANKFDKQLAPTFPVFSSVFSLFSFNESAWNDYFKANQRKAKFVISDVRITFYLRANLHDLVSCDASVHSHISGSIYH